MNEPNRISLFQEPERNQYDIWSNTLKCSLISQQNSFNFLLNLLEFLRQNTDRLITINNILWQLSDRSTGNHLPNIVLYASPLREVAIDIYTSYSLRPQTYIIHKRLLFCDSINTVSLSSLTFCLESSAHLLPTRTDHHSSSSFEYTVAYKH